MAIDFPNSPTTGQAFTVGEVTWIYDGSKWNLNSTTTAFAPIGTIIAYGGSIPPNGWLQANGTSLSRSTYADLFSIIGTTFGPGSVPGTTFALPNFSSSEGMYIIRATDADPVIISESRISVPVGTLQLFAAAPTGGGWLRANGATISRTSYANLFSAIGTTYGSGDGSTTFTIPNISDSGSGSPAYYIKAIVSGDLEPSTVAHAASHIRGGSDIIDGDRVQVDYTPTRYTRDSSDSNAGANTDLTAHLKGIDNRFAPAYVTSLPSTPYDGQVIYYLANATDGVVWQLRYNASSASTYKWEFIGGGSLFNSVGSDYYGTWESYSSLTYGDLATVGPSITVPLAGDYICTFAVTAQNGGTSSNVNVWVTGDSYPGWNYSSAQLYSTSSQTNGNLSGMRKRTVPAAGNIVKLIYAVSNAGVVCYFWHRRLSIQPIRVG